VFRWDDRRHLRRSYFWAKGWTILGRQAQKQHIHPYYVGEMDVDLLPIISGRWMRRSQQTQVFTLGQNSNQYIFGAVNYIY